MIKNSVFKWKCSHEHYIITEDMIVFWKSSDLYLPYIYLTLTNASWCLCHSSFWCRMYFSLSPGSSLTLKVRVKDSSSQRFLKGARVCVFVNGSQIHSSQTLENGEVTLTVPYHLGRTLNLVASREGYVLSQLPWKTTKMPSKPDPWSVCYTVIMFPVPLYIKFKNPKCLTSGLCVTSPLRSWTIYQSYFLL